MKQYNNSFKKNYLQKQARVKFIKIKINQK